MATDASDDDETTEAYTEFLSLLIQDEVARRENKKLDLRPKRQLPRPQDARRLRLRPPADLDRALIHDLATGRYIEEKVAV